ncbi:hypothetical protein F5Y16DRAFT_397011 [Xylariaceae sp. FL0255]|nr:hypothetical protein F5Y16DRAFT_397011 [Xylariaceae sp. FL0255]
MRKFGSFEEFVARYAPNKAAMQLIRIKPAVMDSAEAANLQAPAPNGVKITQAACRTELIADISA